MDWAQGAIAEIRRLEREVKARDETPTAEHQMEITGLTAERDWEQARADRTEDALKDRDKTIAELQRPVDMLLWCPACNLQHVDAPDGEWTNPPHRSHLCHGCGHIWRPSDRATNGTLFIVTAGSKDGSVVPVSREPEIAEMQRQIDKQESRIGQLLLEIENWKNGRAV